jgi:hypothetical protein
MKTILTLLVAASLSTQLLSQATLGPAETCLHTSIGFDIVIHAPYSVTAPLFGPMGERAWSGKHWNPEFIYPRPARDAEGAVFTVRHGPYTAVWVNTLFDLDARHFQYVYFLPDLMVTVIDVRFKPVSEDSTQVDVVYTRTALTPQGNEHVTAMTQADKTSGKEWQQAIDEYLAQSKPARKP